MKYVLLRTADVTRIKRVYLLGQEGWQVLTRSSMFTRKTYIVPSNCVVLVVGETEGDYLRREYVLETVDGFNDIWASTKKVAKATLELPLAKKKMLLYMTADPDEFRSLIFMQRVDQETGRKKKITWEKAIKNAALDFIRYKILTS